MYLKKINLVSHTKLGGLKSEIRCLYAHVPSGSYRKKFSSLILLILVWCMLLYLLHECIFLAVVFGITCKFLGGPAYGFFFCLFFAYMAISCVGTWCSSTKTQFLSKSRGWGWKSSTISPHISSWENIFLWTQSSWTV